MIIGMHPTQLWVYIATHSEYHIDAKSSTIQIKEQLWFDWRLRDQTPFL